MNKSWTMIPLAILKQRKKEIVFFSITVSFLLFSISKALIIFLGQTNDAHETHMYTNLTNNGDCKLFGKWLLILGCFILWCQRSIPFIYRSYISSFQSCMIFHILPPLIQIVTGPTPYKGGTNKRKKRRLKTFKPLKLQVRLGIR